jgi:hypothetical protein
MHELTILSSGSVSAPVNAGTLSYTAGSLSGTLDSTDIKVYIYRLIGTVTLSGASSISYSGSPVKNEAYFFHYEASVTPSGNTFSIFGQAVPSDMLSSKFVAECIYDGSAWKVKLLPSFDGLGIIGADRLAASSVTTAKIADDAITLAKVDAPGKGKIIYGDGLGDPKYLTIQDAEFIIGDTTLGATSQTISGDATVTKTGALTIAAGVIEGDAAASAGDRNIAAATIEPSNLTAGARKDSFSIRLDFDDASKLGGQIFLPVCYNCTVDAVKATLVGAAGSDLTVIVKNAGGTVMTGSQIDVLSATVVGNVITSTVTGNNTMTGGTNMILEPSAAGTLAGNLNLTFCVTRDN